MDRTRFFSITTDNGIKELDFLDNTLVNFKATRRPLYYRVRGEDLLAPDLISYKAYGTERLWWLICVVNNINDILDDLTVGKVLTIPNKLDIYDFFKRWRKR